MLTSHHIVLMFIHAPVIAGMFEKLTWPALLSFKQPLATGIAVTRSDEQRYLAQSEVDCLG